MMSAERIIRLCLLVVAMIWISACATMPPKSDGPDIAQDTPIEDTPISEPDKGNEEGVSSDEDKKDDDAIEEPETSVPDKDDTDISDMGTSEDEEASASEGSGHSDASEEGSEEVSEETDEPLEFDPVERTAFSDIAFWKKSDHRPAILALSRSCKVWRARKKTASFHKRSEQYGTVSDWVEICDKLKKLKSPVSEKSARRFFEKQFTPLHMETDEGILTGYYSPIVEVRKKKTKEFSEPILTLPESESVRTRPRADITEESADVIAYGRPMDVFFMQIQGSGRLVFKNGRSVRAAYAGHNGYDYTSIGRVLISRGDMTRDEASKRAIEIWMEKAGQKASRALMNENKRYIFFKKETQMIDREPKGAMGVSLVPLGSVAIDWRYYPYGLPIWMEVKLPQKGKDYKGKDSGILVIAQDTGKAIKGRSRGDLYFGSGDAAGDKAGVMKHSAHWTILVPNRVADRWILPVS